MAAIEAVTTEGILRYTFSELPCRGGPAIFVDRDGVINEQVTGTYVTKWSEFRFMAGIAETLAEISLLPFPIIIISNQAGVGKGMIEVGELNAITHRFVSQLASAGGRIDAVYYCPHTPEQACECRKPKPGLLRRAASDWNIDLMRSVFIGDSETDAQAAHAAGCHGILRAAMDPSAVSGLPACVRMMLQEAGGWHHGRS